MSTAPDISVIVPTYNANQNLITAINSVIEQQNVVIQLVVIEDGSKNTSKALLTKNFDQYLEENGLDKGVSIRYLEQKNAGAYKARLNAVKHCDGQYIKFLDQDDILIKGTLERELIAFDDGVDVVLSDWFSGAEDITGEVKHSKNIHYKAPTLENPIDDFLTKGGVFTSAALYRASLVRKALQPVQSFTPVKADDWLIFAQICLAGANYKTITNNAYVWRQSEEQLSKQSRSKLVSEHYNILNWIESELLKQNILNNRRKYLLANYYAKQLIESYLLKDGSFVRLLDKIDKLEPRYKQQHGNTVYKLICRILGLGIGVPFYLFIKSLLGKY